MKKSKADINKNGKIEGWESARSKAIAKSMMKKKPKMSDKDFKSEHKRLVKVLSKPTKASLLAEKKRQSDELEEYLSKR